MVKESTGDNKAEREAVVSAISALQARGCDINPYSVAEEANISRSSLVRSTELMRLLDEARSGSNGSSGAESMEELIARNDTLNHELSQLQWEAGVLRRYFQEAQAENKKLHDEIEKAKQEAQNIAKTINIAWQQGYIAGQQSAADAGPIPQKSLVDSLKEAAAAATADGGKAVAEQLAAAPAAEAPAQGPAAEKVPAAAAAAAPATTSAQPGGRPGRTYPQQQAAAAKKDLSSAVPLPPPDPDSSVEDTAERVAYTPEDEPAAVNGTQEVVHTFVADVPLHIEDPEVLNDPFTAKLLSALAVEEDDDESNVTAQTEVIITPPPGANAVQANEVSAAPVNSDLSYHLDETQPVRALTADDLMEELPAELLAEMAKPVLAELTQPADLADAPVAAGGSPLAHEPVPACVNPLPGNEPVAAGGSPLPEPTPAPVAQPAPEPQPVVQPIAEPPQPQAASPLAEAAADADEDHDEAGEDDEDELGDPRIRSRYNADELHNLFRNRFVRGEEQQPEQPTPPPKILENSGTTKKFVGTKHSSTEPLPTMARAFPPEIRKACRLLGVQPEDLTRGMVLEAWKKEMSKPGVHPDQGGDTEMAIYLNTAKDALLRWVEAQTPKLGKKFGQPKGDHQKPQPQPQPKQE